MSVSELKEILKDYDKDQRFVAGISITQGEIDWDWNSKGTTVSELLDILDALDPSLQLLVDVEDGYVYKSVTGIKERYWSKDENILEFEVGA